MEVCREFGRHIFNIIHRELLISSHRYAFSTAGNRRIFLCEIATEGKIKYVLHLPIFFLHLYFLYWFVLFIYFFEGAAERAAICYVAFWVLLNSVKVIVQ